MRIPFTSLKPELLTAVLEEFINREGTDYGEQELSLEQKVENLREQVRAGSVVVVYDDQTESVSLMPLADYQANSSE